MRLGFKRWWTVLLLPLATVGNAQTPAPNAWNEAFVNFFPLYEMARLRWNTLEDPAGPRRAVLNRLTHARQLLDHTARAITAPNNDTLYSSGRLDLRLGPLLLTTPAMPQRYYSVHVMNMHTDNLAIIGRRSDGDGPLRIALVGPGWTGDIPSHTHLVRCDTNDAWVLLRVLVDGPDDLPAVVALQDAMTLTSPQPPEAYPPLQARPVKDPGPQQFITVVDEMLKRNPPTGATATRAAAAAAVGIGSAWEALPPDVRAGWEARWPALNAALLDPAPLRWRTVGGWEYPPPALGQWGEQTTLRAIVALRYIAALDTQEALYLSTMADKSGQALDGNRRYRVRIPPGGLPVRGFWSLSMYAVQPDGRFFFTDNPLRRYTIGNRTRDLKALADGSIDVLVQADPPADGDSANWLPAPRGPFRLGLRAYLPDAALVRGEAALPTVEPITP